MAGCPYTWVVNKIGIFKTKVDTTVSEEAQHLHVRVMKNGEERVFVSLPARSARWLIELIPADVVKTINEEAIPLEDIQRHLMSMKKLVPHEIFSLTEKCRTVQVWLA